MARSKNNTVSPFSNIPQQGRHIAFDRVTKDWYAWYDGEIVGIRDNPLDAELLLNEHTYNLARLEGRATADRQAA